MAQVPGADTVRYGDPWYTFNSTTTLYERSTYSDWTWDTELRYELAAGWLFTDGNLLFQHPYTPEGRQIFGIAITVDEPFIRNTHGLILEILQMYLRRISYYISSSGDTIYTMTAVDSIERQDSIVLANASKTRCNFMYFLHSGEDTTKINETVCSSYEFYFDNPVPIIRDSVWVCGVARGSVINTLYDSIKAHYGIDISCKQEENVFYTNSGNGHINHTDVSQRICGLAFPIVKLRCVAPRVWLEGRGGEGSVTVRWRATEAGERYELAMGAPGSDPDAGTRVVLDSVGSTYTFDGLAQETEYAVWVRKACRYTTPGYDTLVWSDWSLPALVSTLGVGEVGDGTDFAVAPNPAHGTVTATLPQEALGGSLSLCDLAGRELEKRTVAGTTARFDTSALPAGVYLLKLVTPRGVSTRRLMVE